jgi:alkylation response protein AidB-like acyl-CoA dehydrogenase
MTTTCAPLTVLGEQEQLFRQAVRKFADQAVRPQVMEMDRAGALLPRLLDELFAQGLMGLEIPTEHGGKGAPHFHTVLAIEELARVDPAVAVCVDVQNVLVNHALVRWGSEAQQARHLPALATGTVGAFSLSEREAGSDAFALTTRAVRDGEHFVLSGSKYWTTNAAEAGLFVLFATRAPGRVDGLTAFLVDRGLDGLTVGPRIDKLGIRASSTCEIVLKDVRVPVASVLGAVGGGYDVAIEVLNRGRVGIAAQMVGLAQGALDAAVGYAKKRKQFGEPISNFQGVQFALARMSVEIEAARLLTYNAARLVERRASTPVLIAASSKAKLFAAEVAGRVASGAVEIFGGNGFIKDYPAEKFYRDAKVGAIYEGSANIQLRTIASGLLSGLLE